jgi:hypothetical protein
MDTSCNPNSNTAEPDRPQQNRPAVCVIAQRYSSTIFVPLAIQSRKEARLKMLLFILFLPLLKLPKS